MVQKKTLIKTFLLSTALMILSASWLLLNIVGNIESLLEPLHQLVVIVLFLSILISTVCLVCLRKILVDIRFKINEIKKKEKNVKECYQYDQLLNPPIMNN